MTGVLDSAETQNKFISDVKRSVIQFSVLLPLVGMFFSIRDRIIGLEWSHKDYQVQLFPTGLRESKPYDQEQHPDAPSWNSHRLDTMTTSLGSLFSDQPSLLVKSLFLMSKIILISTNTKYSDIFFPP